MTRYDIHNEKTYGQLLIHVQHGQSEDNDDDAPDAGLQRLQQLHDQEHGDLAVDIAAFRHPFHDRFLIIDDDLWHCGASFKDLGRRLFAIDRLTIDKNVILGQL